MTDSTASVYFDLWAEYADMVRDFTNRDYNDDGIQIEVPAEGMCAAEDVLFASYTNPGYSGNAVVIFERDGAPLEVSGSHCSCFGLEGQWEPARVTWAALALRLPEMARDDNDDDGVDSASCTITAPRRVRRSGRLSASTSRRGHD